MKVSQLQQMTSKNAENLLRNHSPNQSTQTPDQKPRHANRLATNLFPKNSARCPSSSGPWNSKPSNQRPQLWSYILIFRGDTRKPVRGLESKHTFLAKLMPHWRSTLGNWIVVKELAEVQIPSVEERVRGASSSSSSSWNDPCSDLRAFWYKNNVWGKFWA